MYSKIFNICIVKVLTDAMHIKQMQVISTFMNAVDSGEKIVNIISHNSHFEILPNCVWDI